VAAIFIGLIPSGVSFAGEVTAKLSPTPTIPTSPTQWLGFAVSTNGRVFESNQDSSEGTARQKAKGECEETSGRTCKAIAVPQDWSVSVVVCNGRYFVGGSANATARDVAEAKQVTIGSLAAKKRSPIKLNGFTVSAA
jgi:hypothetical protein